MLGAGSAVQSPSCLCLCGGRAGQYRACENEDRDGMEPRCKGGRMQMLIGDGFRGRTTHTLWVKHHKRLQTGGYDRKTDEPMEESVLASSTKHKNSRRPEKVSPGTGICPLGSAQPCWCPIPCFLGRTDVGLNRAQAFPALGDHSQCPLTVGQPEEGWVGAGGWEGHGDHHHSGL